jgi:HAMP domain-containing protein/CheY-like chemotaxis protein/signal transduction histidine kinase
MWINDEYYDELVRVLERFSKGVYDFDQDRLEKFSSDKYKNLTNLLTGIRDNSKKQIGENVKMIQSVLDGDYKLIDEQKIKPNDFKVVYQKYNNLVLHLKRINRHITRLQKTITENGKIDSRLDTDELDGQWFNTISNINLILESLSTPISEITSVINYVAMGNLTKKMRLKIDNFEISGDFLNLATTINTMVDQLAIFASEVTRVSKEVGTDGLLGGQAKVEGVSGTWLDLTNSVNGMADSLTAQVRNIADVTTAVANGNLSQKITVDARGEVFELKSTINSMVDRLAIFASEVTRVAKEVGTDGLLGGQAQVEGVSGIWLDLTNNVNGMANNLTAQVRNIADVTTAVAKGDLSQKIEVDAKGEIFELKSTINSMVDQLAIFASEVTRVAKEVGTDGLLGGQAQVEGVSGIWLDLTNNVNGMANNLTAQVRNIADVTTAVAKGDLSQKIEVDAKGEIFELKSTINSMVDQLAIFASEVTRVSKEVGTDGLLGGQAKVEGVSGTWLDLTNSVNGMADSLTAQVRNIADVTTAVAKGDLSQKITVDAQGEVYELKVTINTMVDQLNSFASEVTRVSKEVGTDGLLGGQAKVKDVSGTWLDLTNSVNGMADSLTAQVRNIADVTTAVARGDLSQKITVDAQGEVFELKVTINTMVDQLAVFASEVTRVAKEVGTDGLLGGQAKVKDVSGTWLDLTNSVNGMADSLTAQVRNIAEVTTAVAKGDLSQKITVDARGEVLELKGTINTMVDQLAIFVSEVTRVAKDVGTDGLLGSQAQVEDVSGTWLDLTNNVNFMAENLTTQVRNIADVTTAVARGDLSQKITVDARGEVLELKGTINTMVDQLALFASEVTRVAKEVGTDGLLGGQAKVDGASGIWLELTNNVNYMAEALTAQVRNIADVTTAVAKGDLSQKIAVDAKGEVFELKVTINTMVDQLNSFASEVTRVAREVGNDGLLGGQAKVAGVSGIWLDLTNNVNGMANNLTAQVRNIADVTTAVAKGDLSQKIAVEARGEILELKGTINTMVDQLAIFASEIKRVSKEVGIDGLLGGQAKVDDASGTWLDLTNNVNSMADNLTIQVRSITEVVKAVASGDLTREIDIDVKGEILDLKNNINTMISVLSTSDTENRSQNWIKDGVSQLNKKVLDKDRLSEQVEVAINDISRYVQAGMGTLYIYDKETELLKLEGSYSYIQRAGLSNVFKIGEGVIGQVAYDKKPILLTNVPDEIRIKSGTTEAKALNVYTYPLIFKDELIGVIEVASYELFSKVDLEYFETALATLSGALYASLQAEATNILLLQSQTQSEELEEQSLKLKNQNEELEEQRLAIDTQRKELEVKNKDLELVQVEVNKRAKELEDANRYKSEFLANMSHELRTPLNSMLLLSSSLAKTKDVDVAKMNQQASTIYDAGKSLLNLINDILDLSKIEANLMTLNIEDIQVTTLTNELERLFIPQAEEKHIDLKTTITQDALRVFNSDKTKLTQILKNFLSNAIKFTAVNGNIEVKVERNRTKDRETRPIQISVIDDGIGIERDKIALIFEAFKQADGGTSRQYGGTGLGLSISKEFAELIGGRIYVDSKIGEGSKFSVFLPMKININAIDERLIEHVQDDKFDSKDIVSLNDFKKQSKVVVPVQKEQALSSDENISESDTVILVVEDDIAFSKIVVDEVRKLGHKAIVAHDGNSAIAKAREYQPTAILLDLMLPVLDGMEVLRILKADIQTRHIPVKILSVSEPMAVTKKLGAVDFVRKPISEEGLEKIISSLVTFANNKDKHILIIEDDEVQSDYLKTLLTDRNILVTTVKQAKDGLEEAIKQHYDCMILDINLPDISGFKLLEILEKQETNIPVIVYTARDLTNEEIAKLRKYSEAIILKTATSNARLIEEVSLFLHTVKESLNDEKQQLLIEAMDTDVSLKDKKVLMVDDDIRNVYALSSVLETKGLDITSAQNGKEAIEILNSGEDSYDIVLMDIMMPIMDGYEAMNRIRQIEKFKNLPIIALTAKAQKEDKEKSIEAGANDYMSKPIDHEQLISLLKVWIKKHNSDES